MLGNLGGGWINEAFDWRTAFMVVGLPGILLALIVRFTLREAPRGAAEGLTLSDDDAPPVAEMFRHLWLRRSFRYMAIGGSLSGGYLGDQLGTRDKPRPAAFPGCHPVIKADCSS